MDPFALPSQERPRHDAVAGPRLQRSRHLPGRGGTGSPGPSCENAAVEPVIALSPQQQDDLELLLAGVGGPLMTIRSAEPSKSVTLTDEEGAPLAALTVHRTAPIEGGFELTGPVRPLAARVARPFERLHRPLDPSPMPTVIVPVAAPLTTTDLDRIDSIAGPARIVLATLAGAGSSRGGSATGLIRATLAAAELLAARRSDATASATVAATTVTAPPGTAPPDATSAAGRVRVIAVPLPGVDDARLDAALASYAPSVPTSPSRVLRPEHRGPVPAAIDAAAHLPHGRGLVILFTGLSGSGKSTIARGVRNRLLEAGAPAVTLLDGDLVRRHLSAGLGFSAADRETNVRRIGWVAAEIARHGGIAIASPIAPFAATRAEVRALVREAGGAFLLVHIATPLAECERRDRKELYARARRGEIGEFTGISSPYEEPDDAELVIDTTALTEAAAVTLVLDELHRRGLADSAGTVPGTADGGTAAGTVINLAEGTREP